MTKIELDLHITGTMRLVEEGAPVEPLPEGPPLASKHPGDVGIGTDPACLFAEMFDESTIDELNARWDDYYTEAASFDNDRPTGSGYPKSLKTQVNNSKVTLYKTHPAGVRLAFVRYYIKYVNEAAHHSGVWMGGYNPVSNWPLGMGNVKPSGHDFFSAAIEQWRPPYGDRMDQYDYFENMQPDAGGSHYGNTFMNNPAKKFTFGKWTCVEQMIKLNDPLDSLTGEHAVWIGGVKESHVGPGFPKGNSVGGNFTPDPAGTPYPGMCWSKDAALPINWIWLQTYAPDINVTIKYANVVWATQYIGPIA